jgi:hypothetical protein
VLHNVEACRRLTVALTFDYLPTIWVTLDFIGTSDAVAVVPRTQDAQPVRPDGTLTSSPAAAGVTWQPRLDTFVTGTDGSVYWTAAADGVSFTPWTSLGKPAPGVVGDPKAVSWGPGRHADAAPDARIGPGGARTPVDCRRRPLFGFLPQVGAGLVVVVAQPARCPRRPPKAHQTSNTMGMILLAPLKAQNTKPCSGKPSSRRLGATAAMRSALSVGTQLSGMRTIFSR